MAWSSVCKLLHKQSHDVLSQRYGTLVVLMCFSLIVFSCIQFGEVFLEWSTEKYAAVFNSYSDNLAGKSYQNRLCLPVPIDVVYTWVNGTDPALLTDLERHKRLLENHVNISNQKISDAECSFGNCVPALAVVLDPALPDSLSLETLGILYPSLKAAIRVIDLGAAGSDGKNRSAIFFSAKEEVEAALKETIMRDGANITVKQAYFTSEWTLPNAKLLHDTVIMAGIPDGTDREKLLESLPAQYKTVITQVDLHLEKAVAILSLSNTEQSDALAMEANVTVDGKSLTLHSACILWDTHDYSKNEDISASRFEDNEELRYSLRSVERHAPWVRHIYLVTNGQIPGWLNLDNPRLSVISHSELFPNQSHLPTFSSPAIESHLHRIPGLSDKFLYLNDDVMFGKDVWPDDFFTHAQGHKVYLTWPVPHCQDGCPGSWIKDGYCDKACNNSECEWDGGDCTGSNVQHGAGFAGGGANQWQAIGTNEAMYCNTGCANNWLADKYCDQSCNTLQCGFDAGDCGVENYGKLYAIPAVRDTTKYSLPAGETIAYINVTTLFGAGSSIEEGTYDEIEAVRSFAIAQKFMVVTLVLHKNYSNVNLNITLKGKAESEIIEFNCTILAETKTVPKEIPMHSKNETQLKNESSDVLEEAERMFVFDEMSANARFPNPVPPPQLPHFDEKSNNLILYNLPDSIDQELNSLNEQNEQGLLTAKGFQTEYGQLWNKFAELYDVASLKKEDVNDSSRVQAKFDSYLQGKVKQVKVADTSEAYLTGKHKSRVLNQVDGFLPWEKTGFFNAVQKTAEKFERQSDFLSRDIHTRRLLDTFGDSLRHVNRLFNKQYGYTSRKVPAHMPHMIDKNVMAELQAKYPEEWDVTSSNRIRSSNDMQYSFAFFYYLMGEPLVVTIDDVFDMMDIDHSGVLSDREIRTLATRLNDLPLDLQTLTGLEGKIINCSTNVNEYSRYKTEKYYDAKMPQVTKHLIKNCDLIRETMLKKFQGKNKYPFEIMSEDEVAFKMIRTNVSQVVGQLDDIRRNPKKFICLNDNIEHSTEEAKTVKAVLQDFYESLFPLTSSFELPREYRNRFLHIDELRNWRKYRDWLKWWTQVALFFLIIFTLATFFSDKVELLRKRFRPRPRSSAQQRPVEMV